MKKLKAAFFDIDNTLFNHATHKWTESSIKAIKLLQENGVECFSCSARSYASCKLFGIFSVGIKWDGGIFSAGTTGFYKNKLVYTEKIPQKTAKEFIDFIHQHGGLVESVGLKTSVYTKKKNYMVEEYRKIFVDPDPRVMKPDGRLISCFLAFIPEEVDQLIHEKFPNMFMFRFHKYGVDVKDHHFEKGDGIARILKKLGIKKEEAIAFGDDIQDISMGENVGTFVAVGNAKDEVKQKATFVCDSISNDGIYKFLKEQKII